MASLIGRHNRVSREVPPVNECRMNSRFVRATAYFFLLLFLLLLFLLLDPPLRAPMMPPTNSNLSQTALCALMRVLPYVRRVLSRGSRNRRRQRSYLTNECACEIDLGQIA